MPSSRSIRNIDEVNRSLILAGAEFQKEKERRLRGLARPVENDAERLAKARITNIGKAWWQMRVGSTPDMVYVAPVKRGTRQANRKRVKFAALLMGVAMIPGLELNRERVGRSIDELCARMVRRFNRG